MGRPIGSINRQKPFNDALLITLRGRPSAGSAKLVERAEEGNLSAIHEIIDRLDGKPAQMIDRRKFPLTELTGAELLAGPDLIVRANASMELS